MRMHARRFALGQMVAIGVVVIAASSAAAQLRPGPEAVSLGRTRR